ncbi:hypothetical protein [Fannyhessea vaginae]|nr:hypothetical protein [Fannyhessea vaginae]
MESTVFNLCHLKITPQTGDGLLLPMSALAISLGFGAGLMCARL